jgi:formylglycine-generating enzyme required for sulfatase activity
MKHVLLMTLLLVAVVGCGNSDTSPDEQAVQPEADTSESTQAGDPLVNSIGMKFLQIPSGTFTMGENDEAHQVTLTKGFELGVYEVTQEQYEKLMGKTPSEFKGKQNPVEKVSWDDAVKFCRKLSELPEEKAAGYAYRLPTEAEWEYACRAETKTTYSFGDSVDSLGDYAWYNKNSGDPAGGSWVPEDTVNNTTHPVGVKKPNPWGLYDMHGNVWEWCQARYGDYPSGSTTDPTGPAKGSDRVFRGGSWMNFSDGCSSANRRARAPDLRAPHLGFRVLRSSVK